MNEFGLTVASCAARGTAFAALGMLVYGAVRRQGPASRASVALASLLTLAGVSALSLSPWPRWWTLGAGAGPVADRTAATPLPPAREAAAAVGPGGSGAKASPGGNAGP